MNGTDQPVSTATAGHPDILTNPSQQPNKGSEPESHALASTSASSAPIEASRSSFNIENEPTYHPEDVTDDEDDAKVPSASKSNKAAPTAIASDDNDDENMNDNASTTSSEFSDNDEDPDATALQYLQEGVSVRPGPGEKITGRLSLLKRHGALFIAWLPNPPAEQKSVSSLSTVSSLEGTLAYAVLPISVSSIKAIRRDMPRFRTHKITITLQDGSSLPSFHFDLGGVKSFISVLKSHVVLVQSEEDPRVLLIGDAQDPLQRSLACLQLSDLPIPTTQHDGGDNSSNGGEGCSNEDQYDEDSIPLRQQLLELADKFHKFTKGARDADSSLLAGSVVLGGSTGGISFHLNHLGSATIAAAGGVPAEPSSIAHSSGTNGEVVVRPENERNTLQQEDTETTNADMQSASFYLDGVLLTENDGSTTNINQNTTTEQHDDSDVRQNGDAQQPVSSSLLGGWELVERSMSADNSGTSSSHPLWAQQQPRPPPFTIEELDTLFDSEGRLVKKDVLTERAFRGGIAPDARAEVWKWFLGVYSVDSTREERKELQVQQRKRYLEIRRQWRTITPDQASRFSKYKERVVRVQKDVHRTDRGVKFYSKPKSAGLYMLRNVLLTFVMYNFDLGYVQGMSDIVAPVLYVMRKAVPDKHLTEEQRTNIEAATFWAFAGLMELWQANFATDGRGMHMQLSALRHLLQQIDPPLWSHLEEKDATNLFFCYRWILILFKREFTFDQVLRLWDALFARPQDQLHLYLCVAVLERNRRQIFDEDLDFDGLLALCVGLRGKIDLEVALRDAAMLKEYAGEQGKKAL